MWAIARAQMQKAQAKQQQSANLYCRDIDFRVSDYVYVLTKDWSTGRPSQKLTSQIEGPFLVLAKEGNSYKVQLPQTIKIYDVFLLD